MSASLRRPADVWLPRGPGGGSEALDFAVTSGLRADLFRESINHPETVILEYEEIKKLYKETEEVCRRSGLLFKPMVIEGHGGGWGGSFRGMVDWIAQTASAVHSEAKSAISLRIAQRVSASLQRENARAILRRAPDICSAEPLPVWTDWAEAQMVQ